MEEHVKVPAALADVEKLLVDETLSLLAGHELVC